jgi:hypothetical protein
VLSGTLRSQGSAQGAKLTNYLGSLGDLETYIEMHVCSKELLPIFRTVPPMDCGT